jgi:hypothetical protein
MCNVGSSQCTCTWLLSFDAVHHVALCLHGRVSCPLDPKQQFHTCSQGGHGAAVAFALTLHALRTDTCSVLRRRTLSILTGSGYRFCRISHSQFPRCEVEPVGSRSQRCGTAAAHCMDAQRGLLVYRLHGTESNWYCRQALGRTMTLALSHGVLLEAN